MLLFSRELALQSRIIHKYISNLGVLVGIGLNYMILRPPHFENGTTHLYACALITNGTNAGMNTIIYVYICTMPPTKSIERVRIK